jgi:hypothetical protein
VSRLPTKKKINRNKWRRSKLHRLLIKAKLNKPKGKKEEWGKKRVKHIAPVHTHIHKHTHTQTDTHNAWQSVEMDGWERLKDGQHTHTHCVGEQTCEESEQTCKMKHERAQSCVCVCGMDRMERKEGKRWVDSLQLLQFIEDNESSSSNNNNKPVTDRQDTNKKWTESKQLKRFLSVFSSP